MARMSGLALSAALALGACESPPQSRVFSLEIDYGGPAEAGSPRQATLQVQPFTSADVHSDRRIAWRERGQPFEIHLMDNNLWSTAPARMVQEELITCIAPAGIYESVVPSGIGVQIDDVLNGEIRRFEFLTEGEDIIAAVLEINLILSGRRPRRSIWQESFLYEVPSAGSQAELAMEAMVRGFQSLCRDTIEALGRVSTDAQ